MPKPIIYICGPITTGGGSIADNKARFFKAAELLESKNCVVLHAAGLPLGLAERDYMRISNAMLESANVLYVLPRSVHSTGARSEIAYATKLGLKVISECRDEPPFAAVDYLLEIGGMDHEAAVKYIKAFAESIKPIKRKQKASLPVIPRKERNEKVKDNIVVIGVCASFGEIVANVFAFNKSNSKVEILPIECKSRNGFFDPCYAILAAQKMAEKENGSVVDIAITHNGDAGFCCNVYKFLEENTHNVRMEREQPYNYRRFASSLAHRAFQLQGRFDIDCKMDMKPDGRWTVLDITDNTRSAIAAWSSAYSQLITEKDSEGRFYENS